MIKSFESLVKACPRKFVTLQVPDSKEEIQLYELTVADRSEYFILKDSEDRDLDYLAAFVVARSSGFIEDDQIASLAESMGSNVLNIFALEVLRISGMLSNAYEDAKKK